MAMKQMNCSERVLTAANHEEPDRVPAHINASKWVVARLKKALNVDSDIDLLKALHVDVYDMRGIDLRTGVAPRYVGPESEFFTPGSSDWGGNISCLWRMKETEQQTVAGMNYEFSDPEMTHAESVEDLDEFPWPQVDWFDFSNIREELKAYEDFSIMASGGSIFQHITYVRGMQEFLLDLAAEPEMAKYLFDKFSDFYFDYYQRMFEEAGDLIDVFALADDFGTQNSTLISMRMFNKQVADHLQRMIDLAHSYDMKFLLHTCGNIKSWIPRFAEMGVDILDPIQPECMDPVAVKEEHGDIICLRGGISVQETMVNGSPEDVRAEVKRVISGCKAGGGYILSPGHPVLQDDVPTENIIAMYEAGYSFGHYK
jgi:uroporphyrinogen decarboxylase